MRLRLFLHTAFLFGITQALALVVADQLRTITLLDGLESGMLDLTQFLIYFFAISAILVVLTHLHRGTIIFRGLFIVMLFVGLLKIFELVFPTALSIAVASLFVAGFYLLPTVLLHDIIVLLAAAGIGPLFGLQFQWQSAVLLLWILSVYDIIAVFGTRHMTTFAHTMIQKQASFALIVPESLKGFRWLLSQVRPGSGFLIIGGGDIILPMILTSSVYLVLPSAALFSIIGMIGGLLMNHVWILEVRKPLPALPFIALGATIGIMVGFAL